MSRPTNGSPLTATSPHSLTHPSGELLGFGEQTSCHMLLSCCLTPNSFLSTEADIQTRGEPRAAHSCALPVPPSSPSAPRCLPSDARRLAASRAEHCLALLFSSYKGHPHSSADSVGWLECQEMRLSFSLIVCKLVFCIQSNSVTHSTLWASALPANPPWKGPWELQTQKLCLVPPPWVTSLFFQGRRRCFCFSPHSPHSLSHSDQVLWLFGRSSLLPRVGEPAHTAPRFHQHLQPLQAATDGSRQHNPLNSRGICTPSHLLWALLSRSKHRREPTQKTQTKQS